MSETTPKLVTRGEIMDLALTNPVLHRCITLSLRGDLTWEQAMMTCINVLVSQNKVLSDELTKLYQTRTSPPLWLTQALNEGDGTYRP